MNRVLLISILLTAVLAAAVHGQGYEACCQPLVSTDNRGQCLDPMEEIKSPMCDDECISDAECEKDMQCCCISSSCGNRCANITKPIITRLTHN